MNSSSALVLVISLSPFLGYCAQEPKSEWPGQTYQPLNAEYRTCIEGNPSACDTAKSILEDIQNQERAEVTRIKGVAAKLNSCLPRSCRTGCCEGNAADVQKSVSRLLPAKDHPCHYPLCKPHHVTSGPYFFGNDGGSYIIDSYGTSKCFVFVLQWINLKLEKRVTQKHQALVAHLAEARRACEEKNKAS